MKIVWPDLHFPPINQYCLSCALWFYYPEIYKELIEKIDNENSINRQVSG